MRVRPEHWALLLEKCEKNPEIITTKLKGPGKEKIHALWQQVTEELNSLGFGVKSADHWRKALIDWKSKTKSKAEGINRKRKADDDQAFHYGAVPLSEHEKRLLSLMGTTLNGNDSQKMDYEKVNHNQSWEEEHLTLIVHSDESSETPPSPGAEEFFDLLEPNPNDHDYNVHTYSTSAQDDYSELLPEIPEPEVQISSDLIEATPDDHDYNRPTCSTSVKRLKRRRVRAYQAVKLSNKLVDLSEKTLQTLKNIDRNTQSIAESLKALVDNIKAPVVQ